jgi:hypothetical protein
VEESIPPETPTSTVSPGSISLSRPIRRRTLSSSVVKAGYDEQEEQFEEEHPEQPPPEPEGSFHPAPVEKPKVDIFFLGLLLPHFGHSTGSSVLKTMHSKSSPQFSQLYS